MERTLEVPLKIPESTSIYIYIRFDIVEKCMASVTCAHYRSPNHIEYCRARSICGLARGGYFLKSDISGYAAPRRCSAGISISQVHEAEWNASWKMKAPPGHSVAQCSKISGASMKTNKNSRRALGSGGTSGFRRRKTI
jgi:hypothetical protein